MTEYCLLDVTACAARGDKVTALLGKQRRFRTHDMGSDKQSGFFSKISLQRPSVSPRRETLAICAEETPCRSRSPYHGTLHSSSVSPTMPHSGLVNTADGTTSKRMSSFTPSMALRARTPWNEATWAKHHPGIDITDGENMGHVGTHVVVDHDSARGILHHRRPRERDHPDWACGLRP